MDRALELARTASRRGEVPVGALVVSPEGEILGQGANMVENLPDPTAHAEIIALRQAAQKSANCRLGGSVLVCTLEPCAMCAAAICEARLAGVVFGARDAARGAVVSRAEYLEAPCSPARIWHMSGIRDAECARLLQEFFAVRRRKEEVE